jgi:hypothetical protein
MTHAELEELIPPWNALKLRLHRGAQRPDGLRRAQRGGGADCGVLIGFDTLPAPIREELKDPRRTECLRERFFHIGSEAAGYFSEKK